MAFQSKYSVAEREHALTRIERYAEQEGERRHAIAVISAELGIPKSVLYYWLHRSEQPKRPTGCSRTDADAGARLLARVVYCDLCQQRMRCVAVPAGLYYVCQGRPRHHRVVPASRVLGAVQRAVATRQRGTAGFAHALPYVQRVVVGRSAADIRLTWRP